jgi:hypothetical protein
MMGEEEIEDHEAIAEGVPGKDAADWTFVPHIGARPEGMPTATPDHQVIGDVFRCIGDTSVFRVTSLPAVVWIFCAACCACGKHFWVKFSSTVSNVHRHIICKKHQNSVQLTGRQQTVPTMRRTMVPLDCGNVMMQVILLNALAFALAEYPGILQLVPGMIDDITFPRRIRSHMQVMWGIVS